MENQIFIKLKKSSLKFPLFLKYNNEYTLHFVSATILVYLVITLHIFPNFTIPWNDKRMAERTNKKKNGQKTRPFHLSRIVSVVRKRNDSYWSCEPREQQCLTQSIVALH